MAVIFKSHYSTLNCTLCKQLSRHFKALLMKCCSIPIPGFCTQFSCSTVQCTFYRTELIGSVIFHISRIGKWGRLSLDFLRLNYRTLSFFYILSSSFKFLNKYTIHPSHRSEFVWLEILENAFYSAYKNVSFALFWNLNTGQMIWDIKKA